VAGRCAIALKARASPEKRQLDRGPVPSFEMPNAEGNLAKSGGAFLWCDPAVLERKARRSGRKSEAQTSWVRRACARNQIASVVER